MTVASFERTRCVAFIDLGQKDNSISGEMEEILKSTKKNTK